MAAPEAANQVDLSAIARQLASDMREELLALLREILERNAPPSGSPTALTRPLNYWAFPGNSFTTCCALANSARSRQGAAG